MSIRYRNDARGCLHGIEEVCVNCEGERKYEPGAMPRIILFRPAVYENIDLDDLYIDSAQQLATECAKRGLTPQYLRDINLWRPKSGRWI